MNIGPAKIPSILGRTLGSLLYPQVILLMFLPFVISLLISIFLIWLTKDFWLSYFASGPLALQPYWVWLFERSPEWLHPVLNFLSSAAPWLLFIVLFAFSYPLIVALNLILVSILASTYLVQFLARREYKDLEFKGRPRFFEGLKNSVGTMAMFFLGWLVTLPLWLIPGAAIVLPFLLTAWLNRRVCSFDALTDAATDEEMKQVLQQNSSTGYLLGLITTTLNYLPFAFFVSPVLTMVGFIHLNLQALSVLRRGKI